MRRSAWLSRALSATGIVALLAGLTLMTANTPAAAIQGGSSASDMAASVVNITYKGSHWCTGSVVGDGWVLSAYHCLSLAHGNWGDFEVQLWKNGVIGSTDVYKSKLASEPLRQAGTRAPDRFDSGFSDVMLMKMATPMPSWAKTVPMALSWPGIGTSLTQYGYGRTTFNNGSDATALQKTPDGDMKRVDCGAVASDITWTHGSICTLGTKSTAWPGDSGGPLLWWANGYWQQVGDFSVLPRGVKKVHYQEYWSEADTATRNWVRGTVTGSLSSNTILHDKDSAAAWLYGPDGYRHWIPDGATYDCLASRVQSVNWALRRIETVPDMVGDWASASCPSSPPTTAPPAPGPVISLAQGSPATYGYWYNLYLSNFAPGSQVTLTCRDSMDPGGFWSQTFTIDSAGHAEDSTLCYSGDHPDHWITGSNGTESNHLTW